ncbi:MAG: thiamine phosphate synthase [Bacteroidales bacterium]|nr:thiamine phosphate synthase [Bacteroidales bacterium]
MNSNSTHPVVLAIGGSDSAGMAGVQADQRAITALGGHAATAISAVTAQNSDGVTGINPVPAEVLRQQIDACLPLAPGAIKIGLLATVEQVRACADALAGDAHSGDSRAGTVPLVRVPVVLDPVLASSSGQDLVDDGVAGAIRELLLPLVTLVTPNRAEASTLASLPMTTASDIPLAAERLGRQCAVYLKGGHWRGTASSDYFHSQTQRFWLSSPRLATRHQRGTGCTLASAAATALALGYSLADAVVIAKMAVNQGLRQGHGCAHQAGPVSVTAFPDDGRDLPLLTEMPPASLDAAPFPPCGPPALGLYPVVDRAAWLDTLLPAGVTTIQLRIKDLAGDALREELRRAIAIAERHRARLFINDYWQLAIELGAYGVHLGQEDLADADIDAIRRAGLRMGISTHCHYEVARALPLRPSYLACGPVYPTTSKDMPWVPHGPAGLGYWRQVLRDYPLVAIGGIDRERLPAVQAAGADGIAMISALTRAADPAATAREFIARLAAPARREPQPPRSACEV